MRKKIISIVAILALLLCACSSNSDNAETSSVGEYLSISADFPYYNTVEEITTASKRIIVGEITSTEDVLLDMGDGTKLPYIICTVKVRDVFKGDMVESIKVKVLGGNVGDSMVVSEAAPMAQKGNICFFALNHDYEKEEYEWPVNYDQGMQVLTGNEEDVPIGSEKFLLK